jgi:hypothetical protein
MSLLGRLIVIFFAVIAASIVAGMAMAVGVLGPQWHVVTGDIGERVGFWGVALFGASITGAVGFLPLVILIVLGAACKVSSFFAHALLGAALLLAAAYGSGFLPPSYEESIDRAPPPISHEAQIAVAAGAVFGLTYWLIAGRNAGRWRERRVPSA